MKSDVTERLPNRVESHLLREMWIEIKVASVAYKTITSHLLREMWIEILYRLLFLDVPSESSPAGDVD